MRIAFISGTSIQKSRIFDGWAREEMVTEYGRVSFRRSGDFVLINRHGEPLAPPHAINHRANIRAIAELGFLDLIAVSSVGSLRDELRPGTFVSCEDYVSFHPATFSDEEARFEAPVVSNQLIPRIRERVGIEIGSGKVYVQTVGPRFETPAEIRIIRNWGDVVGMTMASEADLAREAGIRFHSICIIDNYANGIGGATISDGSFQASVAANQEKVNTLFERLLQEFA